MRKILLIALTAAALGAVSAAGAWAQVTPRVGGYREVSVKDAQVVAAARFAVKERARKAGGAVTLVSIDGAERQTVAGANYRLCLKVDEVDEANNVEVTEHVRVVVYQNLKREYTLTSWKTEDCAEDD